MARLINTEAISATGSQFVAADMSAGGVSGIVGYAMLTDGESLSGTAPVSITGSLPAGSNNMGKVEITSTVAITGAVSLASGTKVEITSTALVSLANALPSGGNTIGKVELTSTAAVAVMNRVEASVNGAVSILAGSANIGKVELTTTAAVAVMNRPNVIAHGEVSTLYDGTTALTPKFANISMNTAGAQIIIAKVAAKKLRVLNLSLVSKGAVNLYLADDGGNNLMGDTTNRVGLAANSGFILGHSPVGWFQTSASSAFTIVPDTATAIAGSVVYVEV